MNQQAGTESKFAEEIRQRLSAAEEGELHLYWHMCDRRGPLAIETIHWEAQVLEDYVHITVTDDDGRNQDLYIRLEAVNGLEISDPHFGDESSRSLGFRGHSEHPTVISNE